MCWRPQKLELMETTELSSRLICAFIALSLFILLLPDKSWCYRLQLRCKGVNGVRAPVHTYSMKTALREAMERAKLSSAQERSVIDIEAEENDERQYEYEEGSTSLEVFPRLNYTSRTIIVAFFQGMNTISSRGNASVDCDGILQQHRNIRGYCEQRGNVDPVPSTTTPIGSQIRPVSSFAVPLSNVGQCIRRLEWHVSADSRNGCRWAKALHFLAA